MGCSYSKKLNGIPIYIDNQNELWLNIPQIPQVLHQLILSYARICDAPSIIDDSIHVATATCDSYNHVVKKFPKRICAGCVVVCASCNIQFICRLCTKIKSKNYEKINYCKYCYTRHLVQLAEYDQVQRALTARIKDIVKHRYSH
jgi:hypothetical protein